MGNNIRGVYSIRTIFQKALLPGSALPLISNLSSPRRQKVEGGERRIYSDIYERNYLEFDDIRDASRFGLFKAPLFYLYIIRGTTMCEEHIPFKSFLSLFLLFFCTLASWRRNVISDTLLLKRKKKPEVSANPWIVIWLDILKCVIWAFYILYIF